MPVPLIHRLPLQCRSGHRLPLHALLALLLLAAPVAAVPVLLPLPAAAQDNQALIDRINRLEADLRTLQRQVYRGGTPPSAPAGDTSSLTQTGSSGQSVANQLSGRIDDLENQLRTLTGRFEEVEFKASQVQQNMDKLSKDVDFRLGELERNQQQPGMQPAAGATAGAPPAAAAGNDGSAPGGQQFARGSTSATPGVAPTKEGVLGTLPTDASGKPLPGGAQSAQRPAAPPAAATVRGKLPPGSTQEQYNYAYKLLVQSDYADAEAAFREFLGAHPQDPLAGNAQYWLGETFYVRQQYEPASAAFLQGYQNYPKGAKASDSLLKLGMSLAALKKNPEACAALGQLAKQFPDAPPHVKDAAQRERARVGCK